ncbi:hypothetical protein Taro_033520 [Colocasia esculenta]|uniref:Pentatricopeptide repeat-containing protein n=1 Tax=Colocasia esculenta TaxID=4460 RepID=A0A843W1S3_COLES|nr:hypothetical protein [Colocasia esculenta]
MVARAIAPPSPRGWRAYAVGAASRRPLQAPLHRSMTDAGELVKKIIACGRAGEVAEAVSLFEGMPHKNQVAWNAVLSVLARSGNLVAARGLFARMPLRSAASYATMIAGLSRSGCTPEARAVFDCMPLHCRNVFSWTAMISCYTENHQPRRALKLFSSSYSGFFEIRVFPNSHTFSALLKSCADAGSLAAAEQIHAMIIKLLDEDRCSAYVHNALIHLHAKLGSLPDAELVYKRTKSKDVGTWNTMMDAYTRHLRIDKALDIFDSMKERDVLSWNIAMSGLRESGRGEEGLRLFIRLLSLVPGMKPNASSYTTALTVCATLSRTELGRQVHALTIKQGFYLTNIFVCNSLINMYASCGSKVDSVQMFDEMPTRDVISWNTLILGLGQNGHSEEALEVAERALSSNVYNHSTFVAILTSCSHGGLVQKGLDHFASMGGRYGIKPSSDHYTCVVDMLGRAGRIDEACGFLRSSPFPANSVAWATLLSACLVHGNDEVAEVAAAELRLLEPENAASYVMLANAYARAGRTEDSWQLLNRMREKGLRKTGTGYSWILPT